MYAASRGWLAPETTGAIYRPLRPLMLYDRPWNLVRRCSLWWNELILERERRQLRRGAGEP
jgi:hypothetical protein